MQAANPGRKFWLAVAVAAVAVGVALVVRHRFGPAPEDRGISGADFAMPSPEKIYGSEFDDEDGKTVALSRWKGHLVLLNFWATWCLPCVREMPDLQKAQDEIGAENLTIVGIGSETPAAVREFRRAHGLRFPMLGGGFEAITAAEALGDRQGVLPYTALLSPDGRIVHTHVGILPPGKVQAWVDEFRAGS